MRAFRGFPVLAVAVSFAVNSFTVIRALFRHGSLLAIVACALVASLSLPVLRDYWTAWRKGPLR